jgi:hypothetical protein
LYTPQERFVSGVSSELYTAHRLTLQGYEIFFPLMTQSKADFIALKEGALCKVQVKKATWSKTGPYEYLQARIHGKSKRDPKKWYTKDDVDFFAITDNERVWFIPYEEIGHQTSVCLGSTNPKYKQQTKYDAKDWLL